MITIILGTAHLKSILGKGSPDGKFREYKYSRELCQAIKDILIEMGYRVVIDIENEDLQLSQSRELALRCKIVNEFVEAYKDCIYVSIHVNASGSDGRWHTGTGWEVYTSVGETKADELATDLYEAAKKNFTNVTLRTDFKDGDPDKEAHLFVLKNTKCPAVLTENMFLDNKDDVKYLMSDLGFHEIVRLHIEGILKYVKDNS